METRPYTDLGIYRRVLRLARPYWPHIGGIFLLSLLSIPLALLTPLPLKIAVDSVISSEPVPGLLDAVLPSGVTGSGTSILVLATVLFVGIAFMSQLQGISSWLLNTYTGEKLVLGFRTLLFHHGQRLSLSYHDAKGTSDTIFRIHYDSPAIRWIAIEGVIPFVTMGFTVAAMIYVTVRIDWQLALVALTVSPILFLATQVYRPHLRWHWTDVKNLQSSALSVVQEVLTALRVVCRRSAIMGHF